jgi:hypothetical protein
LGTVIGGIAGVAKRKKEERAKQAEVDTYNRAIAQKKYVEKIKKNKNLNTVLIGVATIAVIMLTSNKTEPIKKQK